MSSADAIAAYGTPKAAARQGHLGYLPIALFGSVMGLVGLSSAWHQASQVFAMPDWVSQVIGVLGVLAFVAIGAGYAVKIATAPEAARGSTCIRWPATCSAPSSSVCCCCRFRWRPTA